MIILIGNKADLEAQRDVTYEEAKQFAEENGGCCHLRGAQSEFSCTAFGSYDSKALWGNVK